MTTIDVFSIEWWQYSLENLFKGRCFCWPSNDQGEKNETYQTAKEIVWLRDGADDSATITPASFSEDATSILYEHEATEPHIDIKQAKAASDFESVDPTEDVQKESLPSEVIEWERQLSLPNVPEAEEAVDDTTTIAAKASKLEVHILGPDLPLSVLVSMIAPFLGDRKTLNNLSFVSKEVYKACREAVPYPPWPSTMLNLRSRLWSVAFSPDNQTLAVGGTDGRIRLFDRRAGPTEILTGHLGRVYSIVFTKDGNTMMTLSGDGDLRIWSMNKNGRAADAILTNDNKEEEEESPYALRRQVPTHTTHAVCLAYNHETNWLATGGEGDIKLYSIPNGIGLDVLTMERNRFLVESVAFSPNGQFMAAGTGGHTIHLWDLSLRECVMTFQESSSVHAIHYSPDGQYLVAGTDDRDVRVWNLMTGDYTTLKGHRDLVWSVAYSPDGRHIASAGDDGTVRMWCVKSGMCTDIWNGHAGSSVYNVAFSPDGSTIVSTSNDGFIELRRTRGVANQK